MIKTKGLFGNYFFEQFYVFQNKKKTKKHIWQLKTIFCFFFL